MRSNLIIKITFALGSNIIKLTPCQTQTLRNRFQSNSYPTVDEKRQLARSLNLSDKRITNWFYDERKRKKKEGVMFRGKCISNLY